MTSIRALFLIFVPTLMVAGCAHTNHTTADRAKPLIDVEPVNPWTHLDLRNDPQDFQFVIVTDRTGGHRPGVFPDAMRRLNLLQPEFVMSVGDLIEGFRDIVIRKPGWAHAAEKPFAQRPDIGLFLKECGFIKPVKAG